MEATTRTTVFTGVSCASCRCALEPVHEDLVDDEGRWRSLAAKDSLRVGLSGSYGEMLDTYEGRQEAYLCRDCGVEFLNAHPWLKSLALPVLSAQVGHECGGELVWEPQHACTRDPERHGWLPIWLVSASPEATSPCAVSFSLEEATLEAGKLGPGAIVTQVPIAHARRLYKSLFPDS